MFLPVSSLSYDRLPADFFSCLIFLLHVLNSDRKKSVENMVSYDGDETGKTLHQTAFKDLQLFTNFSQGSGHLLPLDLSPYKSQMCSPPLTIPG